MTQHMRRETAGRKSSMCRKAAILLQRIRGSKALAPYIDHEFRDQLRIVEDRLFSIHNRGLERRAEFGMSGSEPVCSVVGQFPPEQQAMLERFANEWEAAQ